MHYRYMCAEVPCLQLERAMVSELHETSDCDYPTDLVMARSSLRSITDYGVCRSSAMEPKYGHEFVGGRSRLRPPDPCQAIPIDLEYLQSWTGTAANMASRPTSIERRTFLNFAYWCLLPWKESLPSWRTECELARRRSFIREQIENLAILKREPP